MNTKSQWTKTMGAGLKISSKPLLLACLVMGVTGCGPGMGAWMYNLGMVPKQKVPAEYKFPKSAVLVLIDDDLELIQPQQLRHMLVDKLAKELKANDLADRVTTNQELAGIRRSEPKFDQRGAREVGELANADVVLWISAKDYSVEDDPEKAYDPGRFTVALKVLDVHAKKREDVRLWPHQREGRFLTVIIKPHDIRACKTPAEVREKLAAAMADKVAKLFYDYEIEQ